MKLCLWCKGELPKRRRKYCSDECSDKYFKNVLEPLWWSNAKKMALERAKKCEACGNADRLEVHHIEKLVGPRHNSPQNRQDNLRVLCRPCHENVHHPKSDTVREAEISKLQLIMPL